MRHWIFQGLQCIYLHLYLQDHSEKFYVPSLPSSLRRWWLVVRRPCWCCIGILENEISSYLSCSCWIGQRASVYLRNSLDPYEWALLCVFACWGSGLFCFDSLVQEELRSWNGSSALVVHFFRSGFLLSRSVVCP